jgi:hypothetical protein
MLFAETPEFSIAAIDEAAIASACRRYLVDRSHGSVSRRLAEDVPAAAVEPA